MNRGSCNDFCSFFVAFSRPPGSSIVEFVPWRPFEKKNRANHVVILQKIIKVYANTRKQHWLSSNFQKNTDILMFFFSVLHF